MILIEHILGNVRKDQAWADKANEMTVDMLILDQREAQKSRCRKHTQNGLDIGIALDRNVLLSDGDVIHTDDATNTMVVVFRAARRKSRSASVLNWAMRSVTSTGKPLSKKTRCMSR